MKKLVLAAALLLILTPAASAGAYVGASLGQTDITTTGSLNDNDSSWKILGGYTFMKFVGVEGSYRDFGGISGAVGATTVDASAKSLDVFGVATLPVGPVKLFAKAGFSRLDLNSTIDDPLLPGPVTVSTTENELAYGAGLSFGLGKADIRVEYETFDTVDSLDMISAGAVFKF